MSKEIICKCPDCGAIVTGKVGMFSHELTCQHCNKTFNKDENKYTTVKCKVCGNVVPFDTSKIEEQLCPRCNASLSDNYIADVEVECPICNSKQNVKQNETSHVCPVCKISFDVQQAIAKQYNITDTATVIRIADGNKNIIWKHPKNSFPYASQVVVSEGYTGLLLYNGRCSEPSLPGNYLLSESLKSQQDLLLNAALDSNLPISVEVIFVRNIIDKDIPWTELGGFKVIRNGLDEGTIFAHGFVSLNVVNAKNLAENVGYTSKSEDDLFSGSISGEDGKDESELMKTVRLDCSRAVETVVKEKLMTGATVLDVINNKNLFINEIIEKVDHELEKIGLSVRSFTIVNLDFVENEELVNQRANYDKQQKNVEELIRCVEETVEWKSTRINIHMPQDINLSTIVSYGGIIKFAVSDKDKFCSASKNKEWIKNGVKKEEIIRYYSELASNTSHNVLIDLMQNLINQQNADVRELTGYYKFWRSNIRQEIERFFVNYGLTVESFTMVEKEREDSLPLRNMISASEHKTNSVISSSTEEFDVQQKIAKKKVEAGAAIEFEAVDADMKKKMNELEYFVKKSNIQTAIDEEELNRMYKQAEYDTKNFEELLERNNYLKKSEWEQSDTLRNIYNDTEIEVAGVKSEKEVAAAIGDMNFEEGRILHCLNMQEIENDAAQMRAKWENDRYLNREMADEKMHMTRNAVGFKHEMEQKDWESDKYINRDKFEEQIYVNSKARDFENEREVKKAENDLLINGILKKISESDLDLQSKKEAYARMMSNLVFDDELTHYVSKEEAELNLRNQSDHMKNILSGEEYELYNRIANDEINRSEFTKNADFIRNMKTREADVAHEMEVFKMQYEFDRWKAEKQDETDLKDLQLKELKMKLEFAERMNAQNNRTFEAQMAYNAEKEKSDREWELEKAKLEAANISRREDKQIDLEEKACERADKLTSEILAIEKAIKLAMLDIEKYGIKEENSTAKVQAATAAQSRIAQYNAKQEEEIRALREEIKELAKSTNETVKELKKNQHKNQNKNKNNAGYGYKDSRNNNPYGGYAPYQGGYVNAPQANINSGYEKKCPYCGNSVPMSEIFCPACSKYIG